MHAYVYVLGAKKCYFFGNFVNVLNEWSHNNFFGKKIKS